MSKSTRVSVSLSPELVASLDGLCGLTGYSRAAVLHSLLSLTLPDMCEQSVRLGVTPYEENCRYRGASADRLDALVSKLLRNLDSEGQYLLDLEAAIHG